MEEKDVNTPAETTPAVEESTAIPPSAPPPEPPLSGKHKTKPVVFYISIMFVVALFLIILSFFMQQRNHEALLEGLSSSAVNTQTLVDLELEKDNLLEEQETLRTEIETAQKERAALEAQAKQATLGTQAMEYLMSARLAYFSGKEQQARDLIAAMQQQKLVEALPEQSAVGAATSPRQSYDELLALLSQ